MTTSQTTNAAAEVIATYGKTLGLGNGPRMTSLTAPPTFKCVVQIPQHGGGTVALRCIFKHRTKDQLEAFGEACKKDKRKDEQTLSDMLEAVDLGDAGVQPATVEAMRELVQNNQAAAAAITRAYVTELTAPGHA